jgi:hypothetical protein
MLTVEREECGQVEIGQDVTIDDDEGLLDAGERGGEPDGARRIEGFRFDGLRQPYARCVPVGICADERVGKVAEGEHRLVDPVPSQMAENPLDHGDAHDGQHLLGSG